MDEKFSDSSMKKNVLWNTFGSIFYCGCQWLITVLVIWLSKTAYDTAGVLSLAMTTSSSFSAISLFGMRNYQVSDVNGEYCVSEYVGSRIITCILAFVACAIYSLISKSVYVMLCVDAFMLIRVAEALADVLHGVNQKHDRYDLIGKSFIVRAILTVVSFSVSLLIKDDIFIALLVMAICNLAAAILFDWLHTGKLETVKPVLFSKKVYELLKVCTPLVIFNFLMSVQNLMAKESLANIYGREELGIYSTIATPTLVVQVFASVAFNPFLPKISKTYIDGKISEFRKLLYTVYLALAILCIVSLGGASILGKPVLGILFASKPDLLDYFYLFIPIVWCTIMIAFIWVLSAIVIALRRIRLLVWGMIIDFLGCALIVDYVVGNLGMNGVSYVQMITYGIYIAFIVVALEVILYKDNIDKNKESIKEI